MKIAQLLKRITANALEDLSEAEACDLFSALLDGGVPELELGALLTALSRKDISAQELSGFYRAARGRLLRLSPPSSARMALRPLVIPSYSGTIDHPNLMPLIALLANHFGIPVVVHGPLEGHGRIASVSIFRELGVLPCANLRDAQAELAEGRIAYVPTVLIAPALMQLIALRTRLGFETCAHTVASLIDPFDGAGLKLLPTADEQQSVLMGDVLLGHGDCALLFRGAEGEAFTDPLQRPAIEYFSDGAHQTLFEAEPVPVYPSALRSSRLPEQADAKSTARWIAEALSGKEPLPPPITNLLACCLFGAGYTDDFNQAKAIVAVRTHSLASAQAAA
jgi:anthranilate phosphoribosyltransferase